MIILYFFDIVSCSLAPYKTRAWDSNRQFPPTRPHAPLEVIELGGQRGQWVLGRTSVRWW